MRGKIEQLKSEIQTLKALGQQSPTKIPTDELAAP